MSPLLHPDTILVNGKVTTLADGTSTPQEAEALAVTGDRIAAVGSTAQIQALAGPATAVVDLGGRRVIPGLIDGHIHALRAGRTWNDELRWENVYDLDEALAMVREEAERQPAGTWIRVVGGWHDGQFPQGRGPTRAELDAAAPEHPVYVQTRYEYAQLNTLAMQRMALDDEVVAQVEAEAKRTAGVGHFERDETGALTGRGFGIALMSWFYRQLPAPTFEEQVASTAALSTEFARLGMTGVVDGGGVNSGPESYGAMYAAWRRGLLKTRIRLFKHATQDGTEQADFAGYIRFEQPGFGDGILRVAGLGEVILWRSHDRFGISGDISEGAEQEMRQILADAAARGWTVQLHVHSDDFYDLALRVWEQVHEQHPIDGLRWMMVHAEPVKVEDIPRFRRLGAGVSMQSLMRLSGEAAIAQWGQERIAAAPPVRALLDAGIPLALGSDAMRVANYNPFVSLEWFVTGLTVRGTETLRGENLHTRLEALRGYTLQAAWSTFEEQDRGSLEPGKLADLAVLSADYFDVPADRIHLITSDLTLLGGVTVWESGALR